MKDNYPMMSQLEEKNAPWNQEEQPSKEIEVCISMTISKTVKIKVNDYVAEEDMGEDGRPDVQYNFSDCDLKGAVENQIYLPDEAYKYLHPSVTNRERIKKDLSGWTVDDFEVVLDE